MFTTFLRLNAWPVCVCGGGGGSTLVELLPHHFKVQGSSPASVAGYGRKKMVIKIEILYLMCSSLIDSWFIFKKYTMLRIIAKR